MENILAALPFWSELSENEKTLVRSSAVIRKYSAGDLIHTCIKQCVGLVYVISGNMRLSLLTEEGKEVTLLHIEKNKFKPGKQRQELRAVDNENIAEDQNSDPDRFSSIQIFQKPDAPIHLYCRPSFFFADILLYCSIKKVACIGLLCRIFYLN